MLPTAEMVEKYTKQIEKLYDCECTIETEIDQMDEETGIMAKSTKIDGPYPCRLSYKTSNIANMAEIPKFTQYTSLFCSPNVIHTKRLSNSRYRAKYETVFSQCINFRTI